MFSENRAADQSLRNVALDHDEFYKIYMDLWAWSGIRRAGPNELSEGGERGKFCITTDNAFSWRILKHSKTIKFYEEILIKSSKV